MGEVWRARDTRLGREVAIKVLPAEVSVDSDRLKRFEKEARSASSLNHPNVVTIYEVGQSDSTSFIVMELVDGKTLREAMAGGVLPVRKLLEVGTQIAEGLAKAHAAGIVHRDLKPENVMVTKDGLVKILDFGLAKLAHPELEGGQATQAPTVSEGTRPGIVMGTVSYMSPEQASGHPVDFRSDQFSFGSILYEITTGKRAFSRPTAAQTMAAIIQEEPEPIASLNPKVPAPLRWIVERCLAKEPRGRYASTEDLARDLATMRDHLSETTSAGEPIALEGIRPRFRIGYAMATLAVLAAAAGAFVLGRQKADKLVPSFQRLTFRRGNVHAARFASDGETIVYSAAWVGEEPDIFTTRVDSPEWRGLGIHDATFLSISSLGEIALLRYQGEGRGMTLARVPLAGGAPRDILDHAGGAEWSPDGLKMAIIRNAGGRERVEYPIGKVLYEGTSVWDIRVSPRGDLMAIADHPFGGSSRASVVVVDSKGNKRTIVKETAVTGLAWAPDPREIWYSGPDQGSLYSTTLSGKARVLHQSAGRLYLQDVSRDGRALVAQRQWRPGIAGRLAGQPKEQDLSWMANSMFADISADGSSVLFYDGGQGEGWDGAGGFSGAYLRRTGESAVRLGAGHPLGLSSDGRWAIAAVEGFTQLVLLPTGAGESRSLEPDNLTYGFWARWLPDGKHIVVQAQEAGHEVRCWIRDLEGKGHRSLTAEGDIPVLLSSDGRLLLARTSSRKFLLYSVDGRETREVPFLSADEEPVGWSADGRSIYVTTGSGKSKHVVRLDLSSGRREPMFNVNAADALSSIERISVNGDGKSYAYGYSTTFSDLYLVKGLK